MTRRKGTAIRREAASEPIDAASGLDSGLRALLVALGVLALYLVFVYPQGFQGPFMADDFVFLEKARHLSFASIWRPENLPFDYYRPWSRELQYWLWPRWFGESEAPFHVLAFALCLASAGLYFELVRRLAGTWSAAIATTALMALAPWGALLLWIAGIQDLWMLAMALACLLAFFTGRTIVSGVFLLLALLSKETAALIPAIATVYALLVERGSPGSVFRRTAPLWLLMIAWAAIHPQLGGRIGDAIEAAAVPADTNPIKAMMSTVLAIVNLDRVPHPTIGWPITIRSALIGIAPLVGLLVWAGIANRARSEAAPSTGRVALFGVAWFVIVAVPMLFAASGWHSYYTLLGLMGAWLALGVWIARARWRWLALPLVATLVVARTGRATTLSTDWGSEWYQARAAIFMLGSREYFQGRPPFPPHARVYISQVPGAVGMVPGGRSIVMQVWTRDTTLETFYGSGYTPRAAGQPAGQDFFFTYDRAKGWMEDPVPVITDTSRVEERERFALRQSRYNRTEDALAQYLRLAKQFPENSGYAFNVGSCYYRMGDSVEAARWYQRAAGLPGAPDAMKRIAEQSRHLLSP
jgi:hypothetical protein